MQSKGKKVYRSDIKVYPGREEFTHQVLDFLKVEKGTFPTNWNYGRVPPGVECIVFNPPFKLSEEFVDQALRLLPNLIMFNRSVFLETHSRSLKHKVKDWILKQFWSFANRQSCSEGVERLPTNNAVWYGWFKYDQSYIGKPSIDWLFTKER